MGWFDWVGDAVNNAWNWLESVTPDMQTWEDVAPAEVGPYTYNWEQEEEYVDDGSGGGGGSSSTGGGSASTGGGSTTTGGANGAAASTAPAKSGFSQEEISYLQDMPFSNVPSYYAYDENDLMYKAAYALKDYWWGLKEEMFLYTMHDKQKHRYITSIQVDADAEEIVTTCTVTMPYKNELMEYYIPGQTVFMIIGGTFDREVLFVGRVSEVNQYGQEIQVVGQNIGWKFKQYMSQEFFEKLQGQPVPLVVKAIFKELGFEGGKYIIDLWGIPNVDSYQIDENGSIVRDGETIDEVPDLEEVVSRLQDNEIDKYAASKGRTSETEQVAEDYSHNVELRTFDSVVNASNINSSSYARMNVGIRTTYDKENGISYDPLEERLIGTDTNYEYFTDDKSGDSDHTYEDILKNIKAALDAQFFIVDTTVCFISFNSLMAMSTSEGITKEVRPLIEFWQMQEDSYELEVNQYGFYNTVIINYKDGTLKVAYDDLVRVYGEVPIEYDEPELDSVGASLKAQSYLSAHIRDFGMQVRFSMLGTGKITVASFIRVRNPLTMSESLFYVYGLQLNWSAKGQALTADLDLRYGPENPNAPEVPEVGATYDTSGGATGEVYGGEISADVATAAQQMIGNATNEIDKAQRIYDWVAQNVQYEFYYDNKYSTSEVLTGKRANCYDTSMLIYELCSAVGVRCEVHTGNYQFLDGVYGHVWNMLPTASGFQFADAGRQSPEAIGVHGEGRGILSDSLMQQNY